ncbi:SETMR methyltransferase, partial [Pseudoatta argentina]
MNRTSVFKWCREFKNGRTSVHDDQRSGRPSILTDDIVKKIENALRDDRRLTVDELSAMFPQISRSLLHETITETLGYRKLSARWVPKQLTDQHKLNRVEAGQEFLRRYKLHGDEFLRSIVTGDETWAYDENSLSRARVFEWYKRFSEDRESTEDDQREKTHQDIETLEKHYKEVKKVEIYKKKASNKLLDETNDWLKKALKDKIEDVIVA